MIESFKIPDKSFEEINDIEASFLDLAKKVNEIIPVVNNHTELGGDIVKTLHDLCDTSDDSFENELMNLIDSWKEEAANLSNHPENFPGFSKEVCSAIALNKIHCCSEILKLLDQHMTEKGRI